MILEIIGHGYEADERIKTLINKKITRLNKIFDKDTRGKMTLKQEGSDCIMQITVFADTVIHAEAVSKNMYDNIDLLLPRIKKQIKKG